MKIPVALVVLIILIVAVGECRGGGVDGNEPGQTVSKNTNARADIEVFVTSWCGYCRKMLGFLQEKGIPFTVHDIEKDSNASRAYRELGGNGVPVVRVGSHVVHGYNPEAVMEYYNEGK